GWGGRPAAAGARFARGVFGAKILAHEGTPLSPHVPRQRRRKGSCKGGKGYPGREGLQGRAPPLGPPLRCVNARSRLAGHGRRSLRQSPAGANAPRAQRRAARQDRSRAHAAILGAAMGLSRQARRAGRRGQPGLERARGAADAVRRARPPPNLTKSGYAEPRIRSEHFSPTMIQGALVLPDGMVGKIEASAMRRPSSPCTLSFSLTTVLEPAGPIRQVPMGW